MGGTYRGVFSPQNKVALAQAALYVIVAPTVFLVFIWPKRPRPKPTCVILFLFSVCKSRRTVSRPVEPRLTASRTLVRLASSILHLIHAAMRTRGENLRIPAIILYNAGLVMLLAATTASIRAMFVPNIQRRYFVSSLTPPSKSTAIPGCRWIRSTGSAIYISLVTSLVFFVLGNALELKDESTGQALARTAYVLVALNIIIAVSVLIFLVRQPKVVEEDRVVCSTIGANGRSTG